MSNTAKEPTTTQTDPIKQWLSTLDIGNVKFVDVTQAEWDYLRSLMDQATAQAVREAVEGYKENNHIGYAYKVGELVGGYKLLERHHKTGMNRLRADPR